LHFLYSFILYYEATKKTSREDLLCNGTYYNPQQKLIGFCRFFAV